MLYYYECYVIALYYSANRMNEEIGWDLNMEGDAIEGAVVCVSIEELLQAINEMKTGKAPGPSEVSLELIAASGRVGIQLMAEICQIVPDVFGMPVQWALSLVVPIFKWKDDIRNYSRYGAVKLLEHGINVVVRVFGKRHLFVPESVTIYIVFVLKRLQEEYHAKGKKLYMCFVDLEKASDWVTR